MDMFLPQVKVYSEVGGKPQTWDQHQKGTIILGYYDYYDHFDYYDYYDTGNEVMQFLDILMTSHTFVNLSLAEYVFVSLSLALVIAKFFPAVHNQIVSRATRLEHQSLYWGTAVVSNVRTYGLLFAAGRGWSIAVQILYLGNIFNTDFEVTSILKRYIVVLSVQEVIIYVILFVGAIVASLRNNSCISIPIPRGMAKVMINISFCWSCFCCCFCCSQRCKAKTLKVLVMFSFMMFIHRNIMDVISFIFMMFIERSRVIIISIAFLNISLMIFLILSVSFSLFIMLNGSNAGMSIVQQVLTFLGGVCTLISVFGAVALIVVVYMIVFFSLRLQGFSGVLTGLIPSIVLSAASWYIKKRLLERALNQPQTSDQPECGATNNDGEVENDRRLLIP